MILVLRLLPFAVGITNAWLFFLQSTNAATYPYLVGIAPVLFFVAAVMIAKRQSITITFIQRMVPCTLAIAMAGYGMLLAEGNAATVVIPLFAGIASFLGLELLFLSMYLQASYPVNGLSHLNLSLVPVIFWLAAYTSVGLTVFIHLSQIIPILVMTLTAAAVFYATSHVDSTASDAMRWTLLGAWVGLQLGIACVVLPLTLPVHATLAATLGAFALRSRRYGIAPLIPRKLFYAEVTGAAFLIALLLGTSTWV